MHYNKTWPSSTKGAPLPCPSASLKVSENSPFPEEGAPYPKLVLKGIGPTDCVGEEAVSILVGEEGASQASSNCTTQ